MSLPEMSLSGEHISYRMTCLMLPQPRGGLERMHHAVAVGERVYAFGHVTDQLNAHVFNAVSVRWTKLTSVTTFPGPHLRHTAVLVDDIIYVYGSSIRPMGRGSSMLHALDVNTHTWSMNWTSGAVPEARDGQGHSACVLGKVVYVYGGYFQPGTRCDNEIHKLDTGTMVWTLINTGGTPPPALSLSCHSASIIGTKMFVFWVGRGPVPCRHNISVLDTETDCWLSTTSAQRFPKAWRCCSAFARNGELFIFGGEKVNVNRDLWKFNPGTSTWTKVELVEKYPRRSNMYGVSCCMVGGHVFVFHFRLDFRLKTLKTLCKRDVIEYGLMGRVQRHDIRWELNVFLQKYWYQILW